MKYSQEFGAEERRIANDFVRRMAAVSSVSIGDLAALYASVGKGGGGAALRFRYQGRDVTIGLRVDRSLGAHAADCDTPDGFLCTPGAGGFYDCNGPDEPSCMLLLDGVEAPWAELANVEPYRGD